MTPRCLLNRLLWLVLAVLIAIGGGPWLLAAEMTAALGSPTEQVPPWPVGPFLILRGGGVVAGRLQTLSADRVVIDTVSCGSLDLPRAAVVGYRSGPRVGPQIGSSGNASIFVMLANGDRMKATSVSCDGPVLSLDGLAGPSPTGQPLEIPFDRVLAIDLMAGDASSDVQPRMSRSASAAVGSAASRWVALTDGTRFACADVVDRADREPAGLAGLRLLLQGAVVPLECPATEIAVVESGGSRLRLALVEPEEGLTGTTAASLTRGCTFTGDWPRLRGLTGFTAIGLHAPAVVRYRLDRPAVRFTATVGIDDTAGQGGSVRVRVAANTAPENPEQRRLAAGQGAGDPLTECCCSPILRGAEEPFLVDLPLAGATIVQLQVEPADGGTVLDRTLWLDPQVWFE